MKKQLRNAGLLFTILLMQESSAFAAVKDRFIDEARLSAIFCEKNVTDAARASLTPTLHPKCLKAAAAKLQMPKSGEYRELVAHPEAMALLDAMIQYRLNHNQLPETYKFASVKGMQDVLEKVFIDNKSLKAGLLAWEANKEAYMEMIFPSLHNVVVDVRTALDKLQEAVKSTDGVHHVDALMKEVRHHLDAAIHLLSYYIDSTEVHTTHIESHIKKGIANNPHNAAPLTAEGPTLIQFENERKAAEVAYKDLDRARVLIESLSGRKEAIEKLHDALMALGHIAVKVEMKEHLKGQAVKRTANQAGMTDDNPADHKKARQDDMPASVAAPVAAPPSSLGGSAPARRGGPSVVPPIGDDTLQPAKRSRTAPPPPPLDDATAGSSVPAPAVRRAGPPAPPPPSLEGVGSTVANAPTMGGDLKDAIHKGTKLNHVHRNSTQSAPILSGHEAVMASVKAGPKLNKVNPEDIKPVKVEKSDREQLMDAIKGGATLKKVDVSATKRGSTHSAPVGPRPISGSYHPKYTLKDIESDKVLLRYMSMNGDYKPTATFVEYLNKSGLEPRKFVDKLNNDPKLKSEFEEDSSNWE
jgi:hypothetical protein